jgi:hypothetical protein
MLDRLATWREGEFPPAELRRRILQQNLFGVDRNPMAVRLAELRLWLAVIAREECEDPETVAPLPNLDGVVRQGDSLIDPAWFLAGLGGRPVREGPELAGLRQAFVAASGSEKRECARRLRQGEAKVFAESLTRAEENVERQVAELLASARSRTLFGDSRGLDREIREQLKRLRGKQREIRGLRRQLRREGSVPWFRYESHFGDVLERGGFDLVVGNPPWVRAEELSVRERDHLTRRYRCWRGSGRGFTHQPDLSVAFVERGLELLAPGGTLSLLVPGKLATAAYGTRLRTELTERCSLDVIADLSTDPTAVFEATTYPAALVVGKSAPEKNHEVALQLNHGSAPRILQSRLLGGGPWALASPELLDEVARLSEAFPRLGDRFTPQLGVKTGANSLFLAPPADLEPSVMRSGLRGRDASPFRVRGAVALFFPYNQQGEPFERLPPRAAAYVRQHEELLRARVDYLESLSGSPCHGTEPGGLARCRPPPVRPGPERLRRRRPDSAQQLLCPAGQKPQPRAGSRRVAQQHLDQGDRPGGGRGRRQRIRPVQCQDRQRPSAPRLGAGRPEADRAGGARFSGRRDPGGTRCCRRSTPRAGAAKPARPPLGAGNRSRPSWPKR